MNLTEVLYSFLLIFFILFQQYCRNPNLNTGPEFYENREILGHITLGKQELVLYIF